jgi:glucose/arabinose dehydrogenase/mono/diheme cytochrome c family protein
LVCFLGCSQKQPKNGYIDFLKLSDDTYLGVEELIDSLDVPWDMQYNSVTHSIFFTEIKGNISELNLRTCKRRIIYTVPNVYHHRTSGLLALTIHPDFQHNPYFYTCYTTKEGDHVFSELLRVRYEDGDVFETKVLLRIDGGNAHNGSRMTFGKDGMLYWATGDIYSETHAQDSTTWNGKILRMTDEGAIPADNPIPGSYVYAWGFRNMQGIALTSNGNIITSEHGDAIEDELNWIRPLHNYGWKNIEGYHDLDQEKAYALIHGTTEPIYSWTPVIAPAALHYPMSNRILEWKNTLLLGTLKDQSLHVLFLDDKQTTIQDEKVYLKDVYGRIRAITSDDDGNIYIATSNRDWKPQTDFPKETDDRILKLSKVSFVPGHYLEETRPDDRSLGNGKALYQSYCASCHMENGRGVNGIFPPLVRTVWIEDEDRFLQVLLHGLKGKIAVDGVDYDELMPAFNFLSDRELAEIATYIRSNFGNHYEAVDTILVKNARKQ